MDDDLRLGAALGIPSVPLSGPLLRLSGKYTDFISIIEIIES